MAVQHARFSPSKLGNKEKCSKFDYEQAPVGETNESADEGTLMHKAFETRDLSILQTEEQRSQVEKVLQYVETLTAGVDPLLVTTYHEKKVEIPDYTFGYADLIIIINNEDGTTNHAHVVDAKFGRKGADEADNNVQIMCYAGGLLFGKVHMNNYTEPVEMNVPRVYGHIVAPRLDSITTVQYTIDDKPKILGRLEAILARANDPFDPPKPDPDLCTICQWRATCPKINSLAVKTAQSIDQFIPSIIDPTQLANASSDDKAKAYALAQMLEAWAESARKVVIKSAMENNEDIPGYTKVKRAGTVKITSTDEAIAMLEGSVSDHAIRSASSISLSKLSDAYADETGMTKREARDRVESILAPVLEQGPEITFLQRKRGVSERSILASVPQIQIGNAVPQPE